MPRVVPSQVVALIDQVYGTAVARGELQGLDFRNSATLAGIVELVSQIPSELFTLNPADYNMLVASNCAIKDMIERWRAGGNVGTLEKVRGLPGQHVLTILRRCLAGCPDENPPQTVTDLPFITNPDDQAIRASIRNDIWVASQALSNGEFKAATVLAGASIEALLLWAVTERPAQQATAIAALPAAINWPGGNQNNRNDPNTWDLHHLIEVAAGMPVITEDTTTQARLAKDFRNLIHPGRAIRLAKPCTRATAFTALAAVHHVVEDLIRNFH